MDDEGEQIDEAAVWEAIRRQQEDPDHHDITLIQESLGRSPQERLRRLAAWVNFITAARRTLAAVKRLP